MTSTYIKLVGIILVVAGGVWFGLQPKSEKASNTVAITQIVEHPSLDSERQAITEDLGQAGLLVTYYNAQGNMSTATQIAKQIVASKPCAVVAISTPSAQTLVSMCKKNDIPLIYTAVTDPESAKLNEIKGVCDAVPANSAWEMIRHCQPDAKVVGIIFNAGEANSVHMVKTVMDVAPAYGLTIEPLAVHKTSDISQAVQTLIARGVHAIYIPNDNMAVGAMPNIVTIAHPRGVPVYASDEGSVQNGAVAAYSYSRSDLGHHAALLVLNALGKSEKTSDASPPLTFYVHPDAAKLFPKLNFSPIAAIEEKKQTNALPSESKQAQENENQRP